MKAPAVALEARAEAIVREKLGKEKRLERREVFEGGGAREVRTKTLLAQGFPFSSAFFLFLALAHR